MNFLPNNVYVGSVGGQKIQVEEYNNETYAGMQFARACFILLFFGIIAPFISPLICLFILLGFNGRFKIGYLLCIIFSTYFLFDAYNGWLITAISSIAFDEYWMNKIIAMNAIVVTINIFLLFLGNLFRNCEDRTRFLIPLAFIIPITYFYTMSICEDNPDWLDRNLMIGKYKIEETF